MLIEINRFYVTRAYESKVFVNLLYVRRIEPVSDMSEHSSYANTVIVMDDGGNETSLVYTAEKYSALRSRITKLQNKQ